MKLMFISTPGKEEEELTDEEDVNDYGYFYRKTNFSIKIHGNLIVYVGKQFTVLSGKYKEHPYFRNKKDNSFLEKGKIAHIVSHMDDPSVLWFAFYDCEKHRRSPSCAEDWHYARCEDFITSKIKLIKWDVSTLVGAQLVGRKVCMYFKQPYKRYYDGKVIKYSRDNKKKPYLVLFEDNDTQSFNETTIIRSLRI